MADDYAIKYRAKTIDEYIGNEAIKKSVISLRKKENLPHVILFYGSSGCGKTTAARLLAKEYLCESPTENGPCGECYACADCDEFIMTGVETTNIVEVDLGKDNKRDDIDNILIEAMNPPSDGKYKIYILDECHKTSDAAQTRLLKILEEPPKHLIFFLCTTEPNKLLETIRNRCRYRFHVTKSSVEDIADRLKDVCLAEGIRYSMAGLKLIARKAKLVPRDALNFLERIANESSEVIEESVINILGIIDTGYFFEFIRAIKGRREDKFLGLMYDILFTKKMDFYTFISDLLEFVSMGIFIKYNKVIEDLSKAELKSVSELFVEITIKDLMYMIDNLVTVREMTKQFDDNFVITVYMLNKLLYQEKNSSITVDKQVILDSKENLTQESFKKFKQLNNEAKADTGNTKKASVTDVSEIFG